MTGDAQWVASDAADVAFFHAIIRAGHAFVAAKGKDPEKEGAELAAYLLSDKPLGPSERAMLADLVLGQWRRRPGAQPVTAGTPDVQEVVKALRARVEAGEKKEAAKTAVAEAFGISRSAVENYERMVREREEAVAEAIRRVSSPD